jgi:hypothetical protein
MKARARTIMICALSLSLLISGCGQGQLFGKISTPTPTTTSTPTSTNTLTPTTTPTPTFTNTTIPTNTPTVTPDLSILGKPELPFLARWPKPTFSGEYYFVIQRTIHGRTVTIAWEKTANIPESNRNEISYFYFETFINWWSIFQGFPYDSYTVVFKKNGNNTGEKGNGYEATASEYAQVLDSGLRERIAHEVFHAWVGNALCDTGQKYDEGLWFREGITQYYGDRGAGEDEFPGWMRDHYRVYQNSILGTEYDIPLINMPFVGYSSGQFPGGIRGPYRLNVYWKGALVAYLIDQRLIKNDLTIDDYLRYMYVNFSLKQKCFTTEEALQALNNLSGDNWTDFFNAYIYGTEKLPLNGDFEYFQHTK